MASTLPIVALIFLSFTSLCPAQDISCYFRLVPAATECNAELDRQTKGLDTSGYEDFATCCYVSAFRACVTSEAEKLCGKDAAEGIEQVTEKLQSALMSKCRQYNTPWYGMLCVGYVYQVWLIVVGIILLIFTCGCIIGSRCR